MARENVELHRDFGIREAVEVPDRKSFGSGPEAFIANLRKLEEAFEEIRIEPVEFGGYTTKAEALEAAGLSE